MKTPHSTETSTRSNRLLSGGSWTRSIGCWLTLVALLAWTPTWTLAQQPAFLTEGLVKHFGFENGTDGWELSPKGSSLAKFSGRGCLEFTDGGWAVWDRAKNQEVPRNPAQLTQSVWFYTTTTDIVGYLLQRRQQTEPSGCSGLPSWMNLTFSGNRVSGVIDAPCWGNLTGESAYGPGVWHHIVYLRDGLKAKLFLDGNLIAQKENGFTSGNGWNEFNGSDRDYTIGKGYGGLGGDIFDYGFRTQTGLIRVDDIRIYKRALSDSEVKNLYQLESVADFGDYTVTLMPESSMTNPAGERFALIGETGTSLVFTDTDNPFGPFLGQSTSFRGYLSGGGANWLSGSHLKCKYRFDFKSPIQLISIKEVGAGDIRSPSFFRILDSNGIEIKRQSMSGRGNGLSTNKIDVGATGSTFYFETYDQSANLRYVKGIKLDYILSDNSFLKNGLVAYYPFNGNVNDESGNGKNGKVIGAVLSSDRFGDLNSSYSFDKDSRIDLSEQIKLGFPHSSWSFGLWVLCDPALWVVQNSDSIYLIDDYTGPDGVVDQTYSAWLTLWKNGGIDNHILSGGSGSSLYCKVNISDGLWHHVFCVVDGAAGVQNIYVDGVFLGSLEYDKTLNYLGDPKWKLNTRAGASGGFIGKMDDVRIYNRSLSGAEVKALYEYESAPPDDRFITNGLVAYYPFNGNANDESGNGLNGVVEGNAILSVDRFGVPKSAFQFDGSQGRIRVSKTALNIGQSSFSLSGWFLTDDVSRFGQTLFNTTPHNGIIVGLNHWWAPGYLEWTVGPGGSWSLRGAHGSKNDYNNKVWYHWSLVKSGAKYRMYVNGVFDGEAKLDESLGYNLDSSFTIGAPTHTFSETFLGRLDDVRIYNRALSDAEVAALYAYESAPPVPTVIIAPADQTLVAGQTLFLSAQISGSNLAYRWQKNGADLADGGRVSGATTPTLTITGVTPADAGQYRLTASNANGSATTAAATVTVQVPPAIIQQPQSVDGIEGESVTLQVVAAGSPEPTFQWFKYGAALAGQTTASLVLSSLQESDAGTYRVEARNAAGTVSSAEAIVTVTPAIQVLVDGALVRDVVRTVTPVRVELRFAQSDWFLFYTLDGTDPDFLSRPYVGPINIGSAGELRTIAYSADFSASVRGRPVTFRFLQPQVIDWGVLPGVRYGDRVPLGVTASSGLPVGVSVVSGPAQIVEGQLRATGVGAVLLRAVQAGSDLFSAVTSEQSLTIDKAVQTLTWPTLSDRTFGDAPFGVGVTSSSGLPVGLSVASGKATVSGSQVTLKGAGGVVLRASQAGTDLYLPASEERGFSVAKGSQTVTFPALADRPFTLSVIALSAGSSSGLPVAYELVSGPAQLESGGLRLTGVGRVVVRATQSGNDDYLAATFVERAFEVTKGTQTITFTPIGSKTFGDPPVTLQATASSGLPVTFRVNSGPGAVDGAQLTLSGAGTVVVQVLQAGDANWFPATAVQSVPVAKAVQTLTFQPLPNRGYTTALIPLVASSSSGLPLTYRVVSGPATLVGTDLKLTGVGTVQVAADQAGDANHQPASATVSFGVSRGEQTLTFDPIGDQVLGGGPITLRATSSAGLPVAFVVVSGPATVQDNQLTLTAEGTVVVRARQVGSPLWLSAQQDQTFQVLKVTTLTLSPVTGGSIGVDPVKAQYQPTESVTLTAVASEGYQFSNWTGDLSGSANPATLAMSASRTVGASFKDVAAPVVSWDLPLAGSTGNELVVLVGRVTDNAVGTTATWRRDAGEALPLPLSADGSFRVDGVKLSMGDNRFTLTARDVAGNVTTVERTVTWVPERILQVATAAEVQEGQRIVYPLQLVTDAENVAGLSFRLTYDPTYLADPQVEWSGLVGQSVNNVNVGTLGEVGGSFALAGVALPVGTNPVATVSFRARSVPFVQNVALTPRIVSLSTPAGVALTTGNAAVAGSGRILTRKIRGDNNANQRIDVGDAVVISRLEVGLEPVRSWDIALNDLNDTKSLDTGDVVRALRVVVGLDPQPKAAPRVDGDVRGEVARSPEVQEGVEPGVGWALSRPVPQGTAAPTRAGLRPAGQEGVASGVETGSGPSEAGLNPQLSALHSQPARSLRPAGSNTNDVATLEFPDGPVAQVGKPYRVVVKLTRAGAAIAGLSFTLNYPSALTLTDKQVGALVPADALPLWAESAGSVNLAAVRSTVWPTSTGVAAVLTFLPTAGIGAQAAWPIELVKGEVTGAGFDIRALDDVVGQIRSANTLPVEPKVVVPTLPTDGGPLALDVEAAAGAAIVLETTTDLSAWSEAQRLTGQGAGKPVRVTVTPDPNARARFWRVRVP